MLLGLKAEVSCVFVMKESPYFTELKEKIEKAYEVSRKARSLGKDPDTMVEALPAGDLAARVEGLVGPQGIAERIRTVGRENIIQIVKEILGDTKNLPKAEKEGRIDQALRTSLAIITEGVVAAPIEGISKVALKTNPDGSEYLSVYFSGPIRSAGGTAQGMAVLIADYIGKQVGLQGYRPTQDEVERFIEEIRIYHGRVTRLQYIPPEEDIRTIVSHVPVCVDGDPTEEREVAVHRDLKRVETNRIRGGMCLVVAEGIAQKAKKLIKNSQSMGLDWGWLAQIESVKGKKTSPEEKKTEPKPAKGVMAEVVGGRPIFAAPGAKGAFRLRYGRSRTSGIAAKSLHPATTILLDSFIATGTQLKVERPGKGCVATPCDTIECPVVKLKNGSVLRVETAEDAARLNPHVEEILFLGDLLVSYGDFLQTNTTLLPAGYCEEWWTQEVECIHEIKPVMSPEEAVETAAKYSTYLHPRYTYHWEDVTVDETRKLAGWLATGTMEEKGLSLSAENREAKRILELICTPHAVENGRVTIKEYLPLVRQLGIYKDGKLAKEAFEEKTKGLEGEKSGIDAVELASTIRIRPKIGTYIGARMGRPEKAKERRMEPAVHSLFPIGQYGGKERSINAAAENATIPVQIARYECPKCRTASASTICAGCGSPTTVKKICPKCGIVTPNDRCPSCKGPTKYSENRDINIKEMWKKAIETTGLGSTEVKGVQGMISEYKIPEPLEKGILRARNKVYVFKDGTIRFDATDVPLTHFRPGEIRVSIDNLKKLGYEKDCDGKDLEDEEQILELKVQDILVPLNGADYLVRVARFVDELLQKFYGMPPYYNAETKEDLLGHLVIGLAPHTSAGITGRIIGFTNANAGFAHPYWHAAKRRNCDGDEDAIMLLMDTLLNFSRKYLPEKRGGKMDAPLVVSTFLDPKEIDDEAHKMEVTGTYPQEFYEATWQHKSPSDAKIKTVGNLLDDNPYSGIRFSHDTKDIAGNVIQSNYVKLGSMEEKVNAQLKVAEKIRAIDEREVAELVINSHFLRDTYGNLRAFSMQKFRCVKCNASYRRIPLIGKCTKCGGKLLLTVSEGSIRKYLEISINLCEKYEASDYLKQRLQLLKRDIDSLFTNDLSKQISLSDYM
ncbi:MAG: DNA polymerase II large subunit [Candidatus Altiarchaeota archaeon]|nr:DNA polymerase II large subunit [Candidatus Altiarchaeota archaeon]